MEKKNSAERLRIMIIAQQHGNDPYGLDGMMLLTRDLACGRLDQWLKHGPSFAARC
jgi:hypothetical protein